MRLMLEEIRLMEARIGQLERELARESQYCQALLSVPGIALHPYAARAWRAFNIAGGNGSTKGRPTHR
jgi:hypothetical protein